MLLYCTSYITNILSLYCPCIDNIITLYYPYIVNILTLYYPYNVNILTVYCWWIVNICQHWINYLKIKLLFCNNILFIIIHEYNSRVWRMFEIKVILLVRKMKSFVGIWTLVSDVIACTPSTTPSAPITYISNFVHLYVLYSQYIANIQTIY